MCIGTVNNGTHLFALGGNGGIPERASKWFQIYDIINDEWSLGPQLLTDRRDLTCGYIEKTNTIYIFGGQNDNRVVQDSIHKYDLSSQEWSTLGAELNDRLIWHYGMNFGQRYIFIAGGYNNNVEKDSIQIFDAFREEMIDDLSDELTLPQRTDGIALIYDESNEILYSAGGYRDSRSVYWTQLFYDLISIKWKTSIENVPVDNEAFVQYMPALGIYNSSLFIIGTNSSDNSSSSSINSDHDGSVTVNEIRLDDVNSEFVMDDNVNLNWQQRNWDDYNTSTNDDLKYMKCFSCFVNIENYLFIVAPNGVNSYGRMYIFDMKTKIPISKEEYSFRLPINGTVNSC